ncbi:AzlC family ABC transporter permease [Jannaschia sp. W003]|uniref:AzlC family ABC transporter permease n=1 Tax=Jannaschia sp. W003 TaxID=2867012 RepID=UPI0021A2DA42|nr:AzlC family ABC transporter permease [Jannaschia sp. W003]UWQ21413.1 AzlC family ABC transporter permease [Jannaschia sp. W003]
MTQAFRRGVLDGLPFIVIMAPFGALFGVLATEAGLRLDQTLAFSAVVIAGAAQFTALGLMDAGAPVAVVLLSALAVNLRMMMYSAALVPHLGSAPRWQRAAASYLLVDQTYALSAARFEETPWSVPDKMRYFAGTALPVFPAWTGGTLLGAELGARVPESWPLDFAMPLAFLALVGPMLRTRAHVAAAFVSVVAALGLAWLPWNLGLLAAAALAMATGAEVERRS